MKLIEYLVASLVFFAVAGIAAQAQDKVRKQEKESMYAELAKTPEKSRDKQNPLEKDPDAIPAGRILFEEHCAECHGDTAEGTRKAPSLRAEEVQTATAGTLFWVLSNGLVRKGMPVWSKLPDPQRWQLVSFIKSLGVVSATEKPQERR